MAQPRVEGRSARTQSRHTWITDVATEDRRSTTAERSASSRQVQSMYPWDDYSRKMASLIAGALAEAEGKLRKRIRRRSVASNEIRGEPHVRVDLSVKRGFAAGGQLQKWADGWLPGERANACSRGWSWGRVWHSQFRLCLQRDCATYRTTRSCSMPATRSEGPSFLRSALQAGYAKRDVSESLRACA